MIEAITIDKIDNAGFQSTIALVNDKVAHVVDRNTYGAIFAFRKVGKFARLDKE
jgi:hypothetical protein